MTKRTRMPAMLIVLSVLWACSSPRRGDWSGTFDGTISGTVTLTVNARGTRCKGWMSGQTSDGQPFEAELEGVLRQDYINAGFRGKTGSTLGASLSFTGAMIGFLGLEEGEGDWEAALAFDSYPMKGSWRLGRTASQSR